MKPSFHAVVSLLAILLLARPIDCFASGWSNREAMECCLKGKCAPTAKADCCKNTVPDGNQLVTSKATDHFVSLAALSSAPVIVLVPNLSLESSIDLLKHPPPLAGLTAGSLPLLI